MSKWDEFEKYIAALSKWFYWVAGAGMFSLLLISVVDIAGNKLFKFPLPGGIDIVSYIAVIAIAFGIAETQIRRGHIEVEMVEQRLTKSQRKIVNIIINILGIALWVVMTWRSLIYGVDLLKVGEVSMTLEIPIYPFVFMVSICSILTALVMLMQTINLFRKVK